MIAESALRSAIVAIIQSSDSTARVHRRWRYPSQNNLAQWLELFRDENQKINTYWVRRVRRIPFLSGVPKRLARVEYVYEIRFYFGLIDSDVNEEASEELAQAAIDSLAGLFEADNSLGLGRCVTHSGLALPNDFEDVLLGDWGAHRAVMRLEVTAANVNC
ncbi:MAG: hypothetical protein WBV94_09715 [Blastocatellia bacterium]